MSEDEANGDFEDYVPGQNIVEYVGRLEARFQLNKIDDADKIEMLIKKIDISKFPASDEPTKKTYKELVEMIIKHFSKQESAEEPNADVEMNEKIECKCDALVQQKNQTLNEYIIELKHTFKDFLVKGVKNQHLKKALTKKGTNMSFDRALKFAQSWAAVEDKKECFRCGRDHDADTCPAKDWKCHNCSENGHTAKFCGKKDEATKEKLDCHRCGRNHDSEKCPVQTWKCFRCNQIGHKADLCDQEDLREKNAPNEDVTEDKCFRCEHNHDPSKCPALEWLCHKCNEKGHLAKKCPNPAVQREQGMKRKMDSSFLDNDDEGECFRCARNHSPRNCPAIDWTCYLCEKKGHTSKCCRLNQASNTARSMGTLIECFRCDRTHDPRTCPAIDWICNFCKRKGHISTKCPSQHGKNNRGNDDFNKFRGFISPERSDLPEIWMNERIGPDNNQQNFFRNNRDGSNAVNETIEELMHYMLRNNNEQQGRSGGGMGMGGVRRRY